MKRKILLVASVIVIIITINVLLFLKFSQSGDNVTVGTDNVSSDEYIFYFPKGYSLNSSWNTRNPHIYHYELPNDEWKNNHYGYNYIELRETKNDVSTRSEADCKNTNVGVEVRYHRYTHENGISACTIEYVERFNESYYAWGREYFYKKDFSSKTYWIVLRESPSYDKLEPDLIDAADKFTLK